MTLTKVVDNEERNCGIILKTDNSQALITCSGRWIHIPLAECIEENGVFRITPYSNKNNWFSRGDDGQEQDRSVDAQCLLLLANPWFNSDNAWSYDSDSVKFNKVQEGYGLGEFYTSEKGIKVSHKSQNDYLNLITFDDAILMCVAAFYGLHINIKPPISDKPIDYEYREINITIPDDYYLGEKTGIKTGQFIL